MTDAEKRKKKPWLFVKPMNVNPHVRTVLLDQKAKEDWIGTTQI